MVYDQIEEAIAQANDSIFGLSAAVVGGSVTEAEQIGTRLKAGAVSINDGSLTSMVWEAEKSSFGYSGLGRIADGHKRPDALFPQTGADPAIGRGGANRGICRGEFLMGVELQHPMKPELTAEEAARGRFVSGIRAFILNDLAGDMRTAYDKRAAPRLCPGDWSRSRNQQRSASGAAR